MEERKKPRLLHYGSLGAGKRKYLYLVIAAFVVAMAFGYVVGGNIKHTKQLYESKRLIVKLDSEQENGKDVVELLSKESGGEPEVTVAGDVCVLTYPNEKDCKKAHERLQKFQKDENLIENVEVDSIMEIEQAEDVNMEDVLSSDMATDNTETTEIVKQETELKKYLDGFSTEKEIKVAILDTGISAESGISKDRMIDLGLNFSTTGEENSIADDNGHGTEMASIIASSTDDNIKLMPIKVANAQGKANVSSTYLGIKAAVENGADVINISLNTYKSSMSQMLTDAINEATGQGVSVIVSAGNNQIDTVNSVPANVDNAIVVSAINSDNSFSPYSNYGDTVDFCSYGDYNGKRGTSYAAANVTGVIATALSKDVSASQLNSYAADLGEVGKDKYYGWGYLGFELNGDSSDVIPDDFYASTIFGCNWKTLSDEELNQKFLNTNDVYLAVFLQNLSDGDLQLILSKDTMLLNQTQITDSSNKSVEKRYHEYLMEDIDFEDMTVSEYKRNTGYVTVCIDGSKTATEKKDTYKVSITLDAEKGSDKGKDDKGEYPSWGDNAGEVHKVTYACTPAKSDKHSFKLIQYAEKNDTALGKGAMSYIPSHNTTNGNDYWNNSIAGVHYGIHHTKNGVSYMDGVKHSFYFSFEWTQDQCSTASGSVSGNQGLANFHRYSWDDKYYTDNTANKTATTAKKQTTYISVGSLSCGIGSTETDNKNKTPTNATFTITLSDKHTSKLTSSVGATCTEASTETYTCSVCGTVLKVTHNTAALGHSYTGQYGYEDNNGVTNGLKYLNCNRINNGVLCNYRLQNYYLIQLTSGTGISSVSGGGVYKEYNESCTVNAKCNTGYHFGGWTGHLTSNDQKFSFKMPAKAISLTANALINKSTLRVNPDGGIWNNSTEIQSFTQEYGSTKYIPAPTRNGWKFEKWDMSKPFAGILSNPKENVTYTFKGEDDSIDTITAKWKDITPPTSEIEPVVTDGNYTTETYTNPYNNIFWYKDYLDAEIVSQDGNGSGIKENYLSNANSSYLETSENNPFARHYDATEAEPSGRIYLIGKAMDKAGNLAVKFADAEFYVDGTAPTITNMTAEDLTELQGNLKAANGSVYVDVTEGVLSIGVEGEATGKAQKNWKNVNVKVTASVYDLQSGLMSAVLERYDNGWSVVDTVYFDGENSVQMPSFTITQTGKYRIAVYDKFAHVTYTNESEYWIDKIAPTITIEKQEYGWINEEVPLHFDIADNVDGSGIDTLEFVKVEDDGSEVPVELEVQKDISADTITATVDVTISEEGITYYKLYAKDKAGNESYTFVTVKIDYVAPTGDVNSVINDDDTFDMKITDVVEELSGCDLNKTYFEIKDSDGHIPDVMKFAFEDEYANIHTGAAFQRLGIDVMSKFENCDSIDVELHMFDIAGNEWVQTTKVDIFKLEAELFRYLSTIDGNTGNYAAGETWKAGESGLVKIKAATYVDRIEVIYPDEWINKQAPDVTYPLDRYENVYNYSIPVNRVQEEDEFMIPTGVEDDNKEYTIIVRAFKIRDGEEKMKEVELPLIVNGSLLDDLRTRIRYKS